MKGFQQCVTNLWFMTLCLFSATSSAQIEYQDVDNIKAVQYQTDKVITSGLPTKEQIAELKGAGVDLVISLIPDSNKNRLKDEKNLVQDQGMIYENIAVDWHKPTVADVDAFFQIMDENSDKNILVHCSANYRASAFYYLYQVSRLGVDDAKAYQETLKPWGDIDETLDNNPEWRQLMTDVKNKYSVTQ